MRNYTSSKKSFKEFEDMYDRMPAFPSASTKPKKGGGLQGTGGTTGQRVAPSKKPKMDGHKAAYGKNHPAKKKPEMTSTEDLREYAARRKK